MGQHQWLRQLFGDPSALLRLHPNGIITNLFANRTASSCRYRSDDPALPG